MRRSVCKVECTLSGDPYVCHAVCSISGSNLTLLHRESNSAADASTNQAPRRRRMPANQGNGGIAERQTGAAGGGGVLSYFSALGLTAMVGRSVGRSCRSVLRGCDDEEGGRSSKDGRRIVEGIFCDDVTRMTHFESQWKSRPQAIVGDDVIFSTRVSRKTQQPKECESQLTGARSGYRGSGQERDGGQSSGAISAIFQKEREVKIGMQRQ
jgi:hypothetical protein